MTLQFCAAAPTLWGDVCPWFHAAFLTSAPSFLYHCKHGIHSVSCIQDLHFYRNYCQRLKGRAVLIEVYQVFFCGDESIGLGLLAVFYYFLYVFFFRGVVVAIDGFGRKIDSSCSKLGQEILWAGYSAECHWARRDAR